jgi:uracil-DNA glycosylase
VPAPRPLDALVGDGWADVLAPVADTIAELGDRLRAEQAAGRPFAPSGDRVLAALGMPLADVRVLVVGQDPYPTPGHATGLAFAVGRGVRPLPPSLGNLLTEYASDLGLPRPDHGDLGAWVGQGVLLLNRVLTVRHGAPGSHRGWGWEQVTDAIVDGLVTHHAAVGAPLVALLWGRDAQTLAPRLRAGGAEPLTAPHPSPLSAHRGFLGSRPFSARTRSSKLPEPSPWTGGCRTEPDWAGRPSCYAHRRSAAPEPPVRRPANPLTPGQRAQGRSVVTLGAQYGTVAVMLVFGAVLYAIIMLLNRLMRPSVPSPLKLSTYECGVEAVGTGWSQMNIRYYVFAFLFVIFDVEAIFLFPWAVIFDDLGPTTTPSALYALVAMFLFIGTLLEGLAYAWRKGVLRWD